MSKKVIQRRILCLLVTALFIVAAILIGSSISGLAETKSGDKIYSYKYYTSIVVEKGDTLWDIASEYMTPEYSTIEDYILEVRSLNHLTGDGIHAGEHLTIPYYSNEIL